MTGKYFKAATKEEETQACVESNIKFFLQ